MAILVSFGRPQVPLLIDVCFISISAVVRRYLQKDVRVLVNFLLILRNSDFIRGIQVLFPRRRLRVFEHKYSQTYPILAILVLSERAHVPLSIHVSFISIFALVGEISS